MKIIISTITLLLLISCDNTGSFPSSIGKDETIHISKSGWENSYAIVGFNVYSEEVKEYMKWKMVLKDHGNNEYEFCFYEPVDTGFKLVDRAVKVNSLSKPSGSNITHGDNSITAIKTEEIKGESTYYYIHNGTLHKTNKKKNKV